MKKWQEVVCCMSNKNKIVPTNCSRNIIKQYNTHMDHIACTRAELSFLCDYFFSKYNSIP